MSGQFEVFIDPHSRLRYRLVAPDGSILLESGPFPDKRAIAKSISEVRDCAGTGFIEDLSIQAASPLPATRKPAFSPRNVREDAGGHRPVILDPRPSTAAVGGLSDLDIGHEADVARVLTKLLSEAEAQLARSRTGIQCSISVTRPKRRPSRASTGPLAAGLEDLQTRYREGPALRVLEDQRPVVVQDLSHDGMWPRFSSAAVARGIRAAAAVPLLIEHQTAAVLSLYADHAPEFDDNYLTTVERFAADMARELRPALRVAALAETLQDLFAAIENRTPINLATGIILVET